MKKETRGGKRKGAGRPKQTETLETTVTFRIREEWREPIRIAVRKEISKLKKKEK